MKLQGEISADYVPDSDYSVLTILGIFCGFSVYRISVLRFDDDSGDFFLPGAWHAYGYIGNQRAARAKNFCPPAFDVWQREGGKLRQIKDTEVRHK